MTFREFTSMDEAISFMRKQEEAANARVTPDQAAIDYGGHWMQVWDNLLIFGQVTPLDQVEAEETKLGASRRGRSRAPWRFWPGLIVAATATATRSRSSSRWGSGAVPTSRS